MEEIREAAVAYYRAGEGIPNLQNLANLFFQSMDANRDGKVSLQEFQQFTAERGWQGLNYMFREFDLDGDGNLDFYEVLTLYYAIKSGRPYCNGNDCGVFLKTLFFTCVECRNHGNGRTFDLCSRCYGDRRFNHEHYCIIDNYLLLEHTRLLSQQVSNSRPVSNYHPHHQGAAVNYPSPYYTPIPLPQQIPITSYPYRPQLLLPPPPPGFIYTPEPTGWQVVPIEATRPNRVTWHRAFEALEGVLRIGSFAVVASTVCSIM